MSQKGKATVWMVPINGRGFTAKGAPCFLAAGVIAASIISGGSAFAGPERVALPEDYASTFELYDKIDKPDRKVVRFMYVDPATFEAAEPGEPLPYGVVLIMEDHEAELDGETPKLDADGRLIPQDAIKQVFVMEKQPGWGDEYPEEIRNGDWDYGWYLADGSPKPDAEFGGCFECHKGEAENDYNFSFAAYLAGR